MPGVTATPSSSSHVRHSFWLSSVNSLDVDIRIERAVARRESVRPAARIPFSMTSRVSASATTLARSSS